MTSEAESVSFCSEAEEAAKRFDYVRFTVSDFHGIGRGKTVPRRNFEEFFSKGVTIFSGLLAFGPRTEVTFIADEVNELNLGNMVIKPMPGTLHSLPWATDGKHRVGEVFCESFWIPPYREGAPQEICPRYIVRRQLDHLKQLGYNLYSGFEAEFIVYDSEGRPVSKGNDMFSNLHISKFESYLYSMDEKMAEAGVDIAAIHTEYGDGQFEMVLAPKYGIESADQLFILKEAVKEMSEQHQGWQATFMTKPFLDNSGNGLHFSHSLWSIPASDEKMQNVFHDPSAEDGLSTIARHWIAGLLRHGRGLMALCSPTVNCYRRIKQVFTPHYCDWGIGDRNAAICAKTESASATYLENRLPSGGANPYLVVAATVAAGIDGIVNKLECPPGMTANRRKEQDKDPSLNTAEDLPCSLSESLEALENDTVLCKALGKDFIRWFTNMKRAGEIYKVSKASDLGQTELEVEREMYFKFL